MDDEEPTDILHAVDAVDLPEPDFDDVLEKLAALSMNHLLFFRVQVGRTSAHSFFRNSRTLFQDHSANKTASFRRFCRERARELVDLGLNEDLMRKSILAWFVVEDLPHAVAHQLRFTHVVFLAQVEDASTRRLLAQATLDNAWNGDALKDAIAAAKEGHWIDGEPEKPGLQPPHHEPEPEPQKLVATGRVVTRFEKTLTDLADLASQWDAVPVEKLTPAQARRMDASLSKMEEHIARVRGRMGGVPGK